jgi:hypothetical protein
LTAAKSGRTLADGVVAGVAALALEDDDGAAVAPLAAAPGVDVDEVARGDRLVGDAEVDGDDDGDAGVGVDEQAEGGLAVLEGA